MVPQAPLVVLVEQDEALRELNKTILAEAGYRVRIPPTGADPVKFIESTRPRVVVVGLRYTASHDLDLVSALQMSQQTRTIPVVAVSTATPLAARAKAIPVTAAAVVAPYNVEDLENAVAKALNNPPPAAALPPAVRAPSTATDFATDQLAKNSQRIVLQTIRAIQRVEPYRSRFPELTPGLVDNLSTMLEAIAQGLHRSLTPGQVFSVPVIQRAIQEHAEMRTSQGIGAASAIREYQVLAQEVRQFIFNLVGQDHVTYQDAFELSGDVLQYVDELVRDVIRHFSPGNQDTTPPAG